MDQLTKKCALLEIWMIPMSFIYSLLLGLVFLLNEILTLQFLLFKSKKKSSWKAKCFML